MRRSVMSSRFYWTIGLSALNPTNNIKSTFVYGHFSMLQKTKHFCSNCITDHLRSVLLCSKNIDHFGSNILTDRQWSVIFTYVTVMSTWLQMTMQGPHQQFFATEKTDHQGGRFYTLNTTNLSKPTRLKPTPFVGRVGLRSKTDRFIT